MFPKRLRSTLHLALVMAVVAFGAHASDTANGAFGFSCDSRSGDHCEFNLG